MKAPKLRFNHADSERAHEAWKATCGPHSIAAACAHTLDEVRSHLGNYKGWMSPTMVTNALNGLGQGFTLTKGLKTQDPCEGISRVQWLGPWLNPGVPARVAYFHTHLIAHFNNSVLCTVCDVAEWIPLNDWREILVADEAPFYITHHWTFPK